MTIADLIFNWPKQCINLLRWAPLAQPVCGKRVEAREYYGADEHRPFQAECKEFIPYKGKLVFEAFCLFPCLCNNISVYTLAQAI